MFRLIAINFSQKSHNFSLLSPTSPCELSEREVTSPSNLKVVRALYIILLISSWTSYMPPKLPLSKKTQKKFTEHYSRKENECYFYLIYFSHKNIF